MPADDQRTAFILLGTLPNYHWWQIGRGKGKKKGQHVKFQQHVLHEYNSMPDEDLHWFRKYKPTSPRNLLMYYLSNDCEKYSYSTKINDLVKELYFSDSNLQTSTLESVTQEPDDGPPAPKRRNVAARKICITPESLARQYQVPVPSCAKIQDQYPGFKMQLLTQGTIIWRLHRSAHTSLDIVVMSEYSPTTGLLLPCSFVHVVCVTDEDGESLITCNCAIYKLMQGVGLHVHGADAAIDESFSCMHCRFFKEELLECHEMLQSAEEISPAVRMVKSNLDKMNIPVLLLGDVHFLTTTKFSVAGIERHSIVHLTFFHGTSTANCQNGMCSANFRNKKKIPKRIDLCEEEMANLCPHLQTLFRNFHLVEELFPPNTFSTTEGEGNVGVPLDPVNLEDTNIDPPVQQSGDGFDVDSGLWKYQALSTQKPMDEFDSKLIRYEQH